MVGVLQKLPYFISYILGYRKPSHIHKKIPQWRVYLWSFLASWIGIAIIEIIFTYSTTFQSHNIPMIIASFGAGAVLVYGVLEAPLAQPRNVICGHAIGAVVGVIIAQLFLNIQKNWAWDGQQKLVEWVGGATAVSLAIVIMQLTKTVHPPGGATALIATTTPSLINDSGFYIGAVLLSAVVQVAVACLINNIERRYPQYWWTPHEPIKIDAATAITLVPKSDVSDNEKEEVVADNTTMELAEEGRNNSKSLYLDNSNSSTISSGTNALDHALSTLQSQVESSNIPYCLLLPGSPLISTPGLLNGDEQRVLNDLLYKLHHQNQ